MISIMSGFLIVGISEFFTHKRELAQKKKELRISHLENTMNWLNEINREIFTVSRTLESSIYAHESETKKELSHMFSRQNNELMEKCIVYCKSYRMLNEALDLNLDLEDFRRNIGKYTKELRSIKEKYVYPDNDYVYIEKINASIKEIEKTIDKRIDLIAKEISNILLN